MFQLLLFLAFLANLTLASHFRGGWITYQFVADHGTHVTIRFTANWAWRWSSVRGSIGSFLNLGDTIDCRVGCGTAWSPSVLGDNNFWATATSSADDWIAGEKSWNADLPKVAVYRAVYSSCCWISLRNGGSTMEVAVMLNTLNRPDGKINSSPISSLASIVRLRSGVTTQLTIPWSDPDGDSVRCRQAVQALGECGGICTYPNGISLNGATCTFTFNTALLPSGWFGISLVLEDFYTPTSTTPLSGIITQFLALVCTTVSACVLPPVIVGDRAAGSCFGVDVGRTITERIVGEVGCSGVSMQSIQITGPAGVTPGGMQRLNTLQWTNTFTWTPSAAQRGVNIICATATDNTCFASNMHCFTLQVGIASPKLDSNTLTPTGLLTGTTLAGNNGILTWSFDFDSQVLLTTNPTFIKFYNSGGNLLFQIDVTSFPSATLDSNNQTFSFETGNAFPPGNYYILFDANIGVTGGSGACTIGSDPVTSNSFWTFSIAQPTLVTTTLATATMPNPASTGAAISSTPQPILPLGQTPTTTLPPGVTAASTASTTLITTHTTTQTSTTTTSTTTTTMTSTTRTTSTRSTTTSQNTTTRFIPKTACNKTAFIGVIAGLWTTLVGLHSIIFFVFLFALTNR